MHALLSVGNEEAVLVSGVWSGEHEKEKKGKNKARP